MNASERLAEKVDRVAVIDSQLERLAEERARLVAEIKMAAQ